MLQVTTATDVTLYQDIPVDYIDVHPNFQWSKLKINGFDIAILHLQNRIKSGNGSAEAIRMCIEKPRPEKICRTIDWHKNDVSLLQ